MFSTLALSSALADGDLGASLTLRDSSVIKGTVTDTRVFEGFVAFTDDIKLPVAMIREMTADGTNGAEDVAVCMRDDLRLPKTKALSVTTFI